MKLATSGLHHVTAIARDARANMSFYTDVLGLRLVKRTVNFDDKASYHLYYGDPAGRPGTLLTFFVGLHAAPAAFGTGRVTRVRFAVAPESLDYWHARLSHHAVVGIHNDVDRGLDEAPALSFSDPDGLPLQLVATPDAAAMTGTAPIGSVPEQHALRGLSGVELSVSNPASSASFLTTHLGLLPSSSDRGVERFVAAGTGVAHLVDLRAAPHSADESLDAGSVHHIAFRTRDAAEQLVWHGALGAAGVDVTSVRDRKYFQSIYFHEPGGVRLEIATDGPGFAVDEPADSLGARLQLPDGLESRRASFEAGLKGA